jgi:uncharacterized protein (DUF433 family)
MDLCVSVCFTRELQPKIGSATVNEQQLIDRYIEVVPGLGAAGARMRETGVDIWALVTYYKYAVARDVAAVARDYDIPIEAVEAALAYYAQHTDVLDARIVANLDRVA